MGAGSDAGPHFVPSPALRRHFPFLSAGDPAYRDKAELEAMKTRDPQAIAAQRLLERGVEQHRLDQIRAEEAGAMERAVEHALAAAKPGPQRIFEGLLSAGGAA